jgi:hypothetical protein
MNTFARVSHGADGPSLLMSLASHYDAEFAVEEAEFQAMRHCEALLELGQRRLIARAGHGRACSRCHQASPVLFGWPAAREGLCSRCTRQVVGELSAAVTDAREELAP